MKDVLEKGWAVAHYLQHVSLHGKQLRFHGNRVLINKS
jgi:Zn-dependent peptidase ImmA (M78 family)